MGGLIIWRRILIEIVHCTKSGRIIGIDLGKVKTDIEISLFSLGDVVALATVSALLESRTTLMDNLGFGN